MNKEDNELLLKDFGVNCQNFITLRKKNYTVTEMARLCKTTRQTIYEFELLRTFNMALFYRYLLIFGHKIRIY
jgi:transcriptional regulator